MTVLGSELADLGAAAERAFAARREPVAALAGQADTLARACRDMATRFTGGGRLLVFGTGAAAVDAAHVAVEFVHPVIVGKRSLPARSLVTDVPTVTGVIRGQRPDRPFAHQLEVLGRPGDIALGICAGPDDADVLAGLAAARERGMLTVALTGGDSSRLAGPGVADHCLAVASADPAIVREGHVTAYHLLWELVHVFFERPAAVADPAAADISGLYPFLYGGGTGDEELIAQVARSSAEKVAEVVELRDAVGAELAGPLARCAVQLAAAFAAGGTVLAFGNGGSSTDAQDVVHGWLCPPAGGAPLPALGLTNDVAVLTALANDVSFEVVFARQLRALARPGDVAVGLSTSGGSANVLAAFDEAKAHGLLTVGFAGYGGGPMGRLASIDHLFAVPSSSVHRVQELQTTLYHVLAELTRAALGRGPRRPSPGPG